ncbi:MAG: T9SS type A sorting domain-containing protein, partial [Bacteroidia bacterium]
YTIDGRQGGTGASGLTINNFCNVSTDTTCTIRFLNGASNNAIRYCTIQGAGKSVTNGGVVLFSVPNSYQGNNFNTIEFCNIDGTSSAHNGICSNGSVASASLENTSDTIRNNTIYDNYDNAGTSGNAAIRLQIGTNAWWISGNSIYQSASRTFTLNNLHYGILIGEGGYYTSEYHNITGNSIGGSAASCGGTMTLNGTAAVCGYVAVYMYLGNNTTVSGNTIKNISVTYNSAAGTYGNAAIYSFLKYGGVVNITNNTIDSTQYTNSSGSISFVGVYMSTIIDTTFVKNITPTYNVTNNSIKNITLTTGVSTFNTQLYGMRIAATSTASQGTTAYYNNTVLVANGNTIDGLRSLGSYTSSYVFGIQGNAGNGASSNQYVRLYPAFTNNIIRNIFCNGTIASTGNPVAGGIIVINAANGGGVYGDTIKVRNNQIYNVYAQNISDINTSAGGVFLNGGKMDISKNKIYNIYNAGNASANSPYVYGVNIYGIAVPSSADNNFISVGDTATSNQSAYGIINSTSAGYPVNLYNNTILVSGTSTNKNSAAVARADALAFTGTTTLMTLNNNLLINRRTSSGINVPIAMPGTSSFLSDYNTLLSNTSTGVGYFNTSTYGFSNWDSATGTDNYSYFGVINSTTNFTLNPPNISLGDLFANSNYSSAANLLIDNTKNTCWMSFGKGIAISGYGLDFNSTVRSTNRGIPVCIGANEFTTSVTPPNNFISGNYAANDSVTASFGARKVARLIWGSTGTLPTAITSTYVSGKNSAYPPGHVSASFWTVWATGGSGYTYAVKIFYGPHEKGTIINSNSTTGLSFHGGMGWNYPVGYADTTQYPQVAMDAGRTQVLSSATNSAFALSDYVNPIPVKLLEFRGVRSGNDVLLNWSTATEFNSKYFSVERSFDEENFTGIGKVDGTMNSTTTQKYSFIDRDAQSLDLPVIYYRLRQVDADGSFTYSNVVSVKFNGKMDRSISVVPNPFTNNLAISFHSENANPVKIRWMNLNGQVVFERTIATVSGANSLNIDEASQLVPGVYFISLIFDNEVLNFKVIK